MESLRNFALLVGRIFLAGLFIFDGALMVRTWEQTAGYMADFGVPGMFLPIAAVFQFGGGLLVVLGQWTRLVAFAFAGYCIVTAVIFHRSGSTGEIIQFGKDVAIAGGFLVLAATGGGRWSADGYRDGRA